MSWEALVRCDLCCRPKGETNHWHAYSRMALRTGVLKLFAWSWRAARRHGSLCSDECAHKLLNRYLSGQTSPTNEPKGEHRG
jgi:hypothetical protein